jgi:hypothetical protein
MDETNVDELKNEFYTILEILRREMDEVKREISIMKEKEMKEYNKLLSNYVPLKEKPPIKTKVIDGVEYIVDNNILFNELGEIVGRIQQMEQEDEVIWIKN